MPDEVTTEIPRTHIPELTATNAPLSDTDMVIVEKSDASGTRRMSFAQLCEAIKTKIQYSNVLNDAKKVCGTTRITSGQNLDDYTTPGEYVITQLSDAQAITSIPEQSPGRLTVEYTTANTTAGTSGNIFQTYKSYRYNHIYTRYKLSSNTYWADWSWIPSTPAYNNSTNLHRGTISTTDALSFTGTFAESGWLQAWVETRTTAGKPFIRITINDAQVWCISKYGEDGEKEDYMYRYSPILPVKVGDRYAVTVRDVEGGAGGTTEYGVRLFRTYYQTPNPA